MTDESNQTTPKKNVDFKQLLQSVQTSRYLDNLKNLELTSGIGLIVLIGLLLMFLIGWWWSRSPNLFDVQAIAQQRAEHYNEKLVSGYITTNTLIEVTSRLLDKSGGYLSNDIMPPSIFMDDMAHWEWGVLQQVRDFSKALHNDISRSRTLASEDSDLAKAVQQFNIDNQSWFWPTSESEYQEGIDLIEKYLHRLADPRFKHKTSFVAKTDKLRDWLEDVIKRLSHLSQRLSASVGHNQVITHLPSDENPEPDIIQPVEIEEKTSWMEIDNVFYEARGASYALIHFLRAIEIDFKEALEKKNATVILQEVIRELKATQKTLWSPMVLNGTEFGLVANHSLVLSSYISRANTGIIELYNSL